MGYTLGANGQCVDINECAFANGGCDTKTTCFNTPGSRQCGPCPPGYTGNGVTGCADINECNINHGGCDPLQACINTAGSRVCGQCPEGYVQQGAQCVPGFAANEHSAPAPAPADADQEYLAVLPTAQRLRHSVRRGRRA
jgi:hypothetical protein